MQITIPKQAIQAWRAHLKTQQNLLEQAFFANKNSASLLKKHATLVDKLLQSVWLEANLNQDVSLIAVGGYGRGELFPYSDVDLLILVPAHISAAQNLEIEGLVSVLWDIGLNIGHSVRNLQECIKEAQEDTTIQTNLLEARLLHGEKRTFEAFVTGTTQSLDVVNFLAAKTREQNDRHGKFNDTAYNLEPNIKESPGGLRDLHSILWLAQSQRFGRTWPELSKNGLINKIELREIKRHERNLNTLRIRLHYLAKRREDRLLFDFQNELAENLGLVNNASKRASEQLMQSYYRSARYVSLINEILLKLLSENLTPNQATIAINDRFLARGNIVEPVTSNLFERQPSAIFECFLLLQTHPQLEGFGSTLLRQLQSAKKLITKQFRQSAKNRKLFLSILAEKNGVNHSLRRMSRYGILGQYIPAFGKITGQMQHDLFHVYTVDEHTLNVLANLRRFSKPELIQEFPLCNQLFSAFNKPHLLYIAALFHDIAKGRGGDHSELGRADAKRFCKSHELSAQDTHLVAWLVGAHLQLSKVAQKSDLSDPLVIDKFAEYVTNERYLTALYLLTVADVRGTSPAVWNAWKARLLENLFLQTRRALNNASLSVEQVIKQRQTEAAHKLNTYGLEPKAYKEFWHNAGEAYFTRYTSNEIAWQSRLLISHTFTNKPVVRAHLSPDGDGIQVMIYTRNQDDLFARICDFFDRIAHNVGEATIYTTEHGYALNTFIIIYQSDMDDSYSELLKSIEDDLHEKLLTMPPLDTPMQGRISRQVKHMPIKPQVTFEKEAENIFHTVSIIVSDRPGLLTAVAFVFWQHDVELHNAKINTLGNRAEDSFLISAKQNEPLNEIQVELLRKALLDV